MSQTRRGTVILTILVLAVAVATAFSVASFIENRQRQAPYSSYTSNENGFYGAYKLIDMTFPGRIHREISPLSALLRRNPVIITARVEWSKKEQRQLEVWMQHGGVLLDLKPSENELGDYASERTAEPDPQWKGFKDIPKVPLPSGHVIKLAECQVPIYRSSFGPEIVVEQVGKGRRILFSDALTNEDLKRHPEAGAVFAKIVALYLRGRTSAAWDEGYSLSGPPAKNPGSIPPQWFAVLEQLILLAILYCLARGWRFGAPVPLNFGGNMTLQDYLHSLAGFYFKAGARTLALEELINDLRRRLAKATGLSIGAGDERLVVAYQNIYQRDPQALRQLLQECGDAIDRQRVGERQLYHLGRMIDNFRREIDRYGIER